MSDQFDNWYDEILTREDDALIWNYYVRPSEDRRGYIKRDPNHGIGIADPLTEESNLIVHNVNTGQFQDVDLSGKEINRLTFSSCNGLVLECENYPSKVNILTFDYCTILDDQLGPEVHMVINCLRFAASTRLESGRVHRPPAWTVNKVKFDFYNLENVKYIWDIIRDIVPRTVSSIDLTDSLRIQGERYYGIAYTDDIIQEYNEMVFYILQTFPRVSNMRFIVSQKFTKRQMNVLEKKAQSLFIDPGRFEIKIVDVQKKSY